ncbi:hypothetical protein NL676_003909 [Syzygium grande]|nr:hypothetical protein NL676_003909 [Syzygium grande]
MATRVNCSAWFGNPWHSIHLQAFLSRPRLQFRPALFSSSSYASSATRGAVCCTGSSNDASETDRPFLSSRRRFTTSMPLPMGSAYPNTIAADAIARFQTVFSRCSGVFP